MADNTAIEWTDAMWIDRGGRRVRTYRRQDPARPGQQLRRQMAARGLRWCCDCRAWLPATEVTKQGRCRAHEREAYRRYYAGMGGPVIRARARARKRRTQPLPPAAGELLLDLYGEQCVYCGGLPETRDHVLPLSRGGETQPGNVVPACASCNSSKKDRSPLEWHPPRIDSAALFEVIALAAEAGWL
ncbi:MAG: hypothetical protein C3F12_00555 [Candidatus Methylomirabilota bacterium]|nr:MAG: hypothetical protein C3F12_00555 [candidate division NC10 bacterium]